MDEEFATVVEKFINCKYTYLEFSKKYIEKFIYPSLKGISQQSLPHFVVEQEDKTKAAYYSPSLNTIGLCINYNKSGKEARSFDVMRIIQSLAHEYRHFQQYHLRGDGIKLRYDYTDEELKMIMEILNDSDPEFRKIISSDFHQLKRFLYYNDWREVDARKAEEKATELFKEYLKNYPDIYHQITKFETPENHKFDEFYYAFGKFKSEGIDKIAKTYQNRINAIMYNGSDIYELDKIQEALKLVALLIGQYSEELLEEKYRQYVKAGYFSIASIFQRKLPNGNRIYKELLFKGEDLSNNSFYNLKDMTISQIELLFEKYISDKKLEYCSSIMVGLKEERAVKLLQTNGVFYEEISKLIDRLESESNNNTLLYDDVDDALSLMEQIMLKFNCSFIDEDDKPKSELERNIKFLYDRLHRISINEIEKINPYYDLNSNRYRHSQDREKYLLDAKERLERYKSIYGENFIRENYDRLNLDHLSRRTIASLIKEYNFINDNGEISEEILEQLTKKIHDTISNTIEDEGIISVEKIYKKLLEQNNYNLACAILSGCDVYYKVFSLDELMDFYDNYINEISENNADRLKKQIESYLDHLCEEGDIRKAKILYENYMSSGDEVKAYFLYEYIIKKFPDENNLDFHRFEGRTFYTISQLDKLYSRVFQSFSKAKKEIKKSINESTKKEIEELINKLNGSGESKDFHEDRKEIMDLINTLMQVNGKEFLINEFQYSLSKKNYEVAYYLYMYLKKVDLKYDVFKNMIKKRDDAALKKLLRQKENSLYKKEMCLKSLDSLIQEYESIEKDKADSSELEDLLKQIASVIYWDTDEKKWNEFEEKYDYYLDNNKCDIASAILRGLIFKDVDKDHYFKMRFTYKVGSLFSVNLNESKRIFSDVKIFLDYLYDSKGIYAVYECYRAFMSHNYYNPAYLCYQYICEKCPGKFKFNSELFENKSDVYLRGIQFLENGVSSISRRCKYNFDNISNDKNAMRSKDWLFSRISEWMEIEGEESVKKEYEYRLEKKDYPAAYFLYMFLKNEQIKYKEFKNMCENKNINTSEGRK